MRSIALVGMVGATMIAAFGGAAELSQAELERRCEMAREKKLVPLRTAEIKKCKTMKDNDPDWCDRYWADYGNGGKAGNQVRPRLFDDLPECVAARKTRVQ